MKKKVSILLALALTLSVSLVHAEGPDATSSASTKAETTTSSPAPVKTTAPAPAPATSVKANNGVHVVAGGDTMKAIAKAYGLSLNQLITLNPQITNPTMIFPGDKVYLRAGVVETPPPAAINPTKIYQGLGHTLAFRNGPGKDSEGVPVYSFNIVMASATFDADGRIVNVYLDGYEVATPNYDGASMPHFSGWPGKEGYNEFNHETEKISGIKSNTPETAAAEVNAWKTKRERGDSYGMNKNNDWYKQMDFYQKFFVGKTIAELNDWYAKNTTAAGRPIKLNTTNAQEQEKLAKLTEAEKAVLADVVSGATMSMKDPHGDFLGAIENAYKNRVEIALPTK
jgi:LysM repeat protein